MPSKQIVIFILICSLGLAGCDPDGSGTEWEIHDTAPPVIERTKVERTKYEPKPESSSRYPAAWIPSRNLENKSRWQGIVIHHSASYYGCAAHEDKSHKARGWGGLGYHFVINNGVYRNGYGKKNGLVEVGYRWRNQLTGSHSRANGDSSNYWNKHTIGICLIGNFENTQPTQEQMRSLVSLVKFLQQRYNIPVSKIQGHKDIKPTDCPGKNFSFYELRSRLSKYR